MSRIGRIGVLSLATFALAVCALTPAYAQIVNPSTCANYPGLTNHIAGCVRDTLDSATSAYFTGFYPLVSEAIGGMMTLAVIVFGCMAAAGALEKIGRDSIMLVLRIALVSYFSMNSDFMYHQVIGMMDGISQSIVGFVPSSGATDGTPGSDFSQITCLKNMRDAHDGSSTGGQKGVVGPWVAMDCMIDSVIGIKIDPKVGITGTAMSDVKAYNEKLKAGDQGLSRGLLYLFFAAYQTSILGVILALIGFVFIWGMINLIIKSLFIYLAGYIGLAVMMMVAPLFIPLALFQRTKEYFDKWVKLVISFSLQPVIILVFVVFSIAAVDLATFSGDYSMMYRLAGDASRAPDFSLNEYLTAERSAPTDDDPDATRAIIAKTPLDWAQVKADTNTKIPDDDSSTDNVNGFISGLTNSKCTKDKMDADADLKKLCSSSYPLRVYRDTIDWDLLASARSPSVVVSDDATTPAEQISREVLAAAMFAGVVVFVMGELLKVIPLVAYDLVGDFGQSPNLGKVGGALPGKGALQSSLKSMVTQRGGT